MLLQEKNYLTKYFVPQVQSCQWLQEKTPPHILFSNVHMVQLFELLIKTVLKILLFFNEVGMKT